MADWDYGGAWRMHDMEGVIDLPNGSCVQVHDITHGLPEFMRLADTLFIDPPCSTGNLKSFHTKADSELSYSFGDFEDALFARINDIAPRHLFMEVFSSNKAVFIDRIKSLFHNVRIYDSFYYNKKTNKCWIIHASNEPIEEYPIDGIDETKAIKWIAENHSFSCIGDLCMGRGTVGWYAYLSGKRFVGTELNKKRLGVLVDRIRSDHVS